MGFDKRRYREYKKRIKEETSELEKLLIAGIENGNLSKFIAQLYRMSLNLNVRYRGYTIFIRVNDHNFNYQIFPTKNEEEYQRLNQILQYISYNFPPTPESFNDLVQNKISNEEFMKQLPEGVEYYVTLIERINSCIKFWKENGKIYYKKISAGKGKRYRKEEVDEIIKSWRFLFTI